MARVVWKENKILSIELRTGLFVLAKMIKDPYLVFFDSFSTDGKFLSINLESIPVLFCAAVTRQFIQNSNITTLKDIKPILDYKPPCFWIKIDALGSRNITLWKGTQDEETTLVLGEGDAELIERDILNTQMPVKVVMDFPPFKMDIIDKYELTNVRMYPELNERLYLCYKLKRNLDPLKDLTFKSDCPIEYKIYMKIINGTIDENEWKLLSI